MTIEKQTSASESNAVGKLPKGARLAYGFLVAAFLAIIFCGAIFQPALDIARRERPQVLDVFTRAPSEKNLRTYEKDMEDSSLIIKGVRPYMQYAQFLTLKDLGRDGLVGRDGWFFYKPDVRFLIEPWNGYDNVLNAVRAFNDALAARCIRLLVVPAPGKPSIYPDKITARAEHLDRSVHGYSQETIARLRQAGIEVVDLFTLFEQNRSKGTLYLKQDTHWAPEGMSLAAHEVAAELLAKGWIAKGSVSFTIKPVAIKRHGDVLRMARSQEISNNYLPEEMECSQVLREDTGEPFKADPDSDILVLGDSFLRIYERDEPGSAGFTAHLSRELSKPVASIINDGGASTLVRQELARKPQLLQNKKVVVWEFVERDLRFGTEGWQAVPLPEPATAAQQ